MFPVEVGLILQDCSMMSGGTVCGLALWKLTKQNTGTVG
jgi:hypothetical protein